MFRETVAEISLPALTNNLKQVLKRVGQKKIIAVVKADAYGHGIVAISRHLTSASPQIAMLGVASFDEGVILRKAGIETPILLMTGASSVDRVHDLVHYRLTPALYDIETLSRFSRYTKRTGHRLTVHLKVDTGMGRLGIPHEQAVDFIQKMLDSGIDLEAVFSHFSDADLTNLSYAHEQLSRLKQIKEKLKEKGISPLFHLANSAAIISLADAHFDAVRPGLMLYGYSPLQQEDPLGLLPILTVKSRVISIKKVAADTPISYGRTFVTQRPTTVAAVSIGYADGYPRALSNRSEMIAQGLRVPVIGRVCMDVTLLDVTAVPHLAVGDWVTVIGKEGNVSIGGGELAQKANTIVYEILCAMNKQIPKVYLTSGDRG